MPLSPPDDDELELSVFGRGYGEAVSIHLGDGEWVLVDSCLNPDRRPAGLAYLERLGLVPAEVVRLILATHWDDDHIQGISRTLEACPNARVAMSSALNRKDIFAFVVQQEGAKGASGSGVDELRQLLRISSDRGISIIWAKANVPLHPTPPGDFPSVVALSPSDDAFERSVSHLIEAATSMRSSVRRRYRAPEGPNGASVATHVRSDDVAMLLGADLEVSSNSNAGWDGVIKYAAPAVKASILKVPHHGSPTAHHDGMWADLLDDEPIAILAPWSRGAKYLPTAADLERLQNLASRVFLTATPSLKRARKDQDLDRLIRKLHGERILQLVGWGHVQARRRAEEEAWRVDLYGDATAVSS